MRTGMLEPSAQQVGPELPASPGSAGSLDSLDSQDSLASLELPALPAPPGSADGAGSGHKEILEFPAPAACRVSADYPDRAVCQDRLVSAGRADTRGHLDRVAIPAHRVSAATRG